MNAFPLIAAPERDGGSAFPMRRITIASIQEAIARHFGTTVLELKSERRWGESARDRHLAMLLAYELTPHSFVTIGRHFGGRDHTTVRNALYRARDRISVDAELREKVDCIRAELGA